MGTSRQPVVCVVGAGTAALEGLMSARARLGPLVELRLVAPDREFRYRPMDPDSPFRPARERGLKIADVAKEVDARWIADRADIVDESERIVITREGDVVHFDYLLLAPGERSARALHQGQVWARGADPGFLDETIQAMASAEASSVAVVVPRGARWPLPAYELALVLAWSKVADSSSVTLLTAEERPLAAFGSQASGLVEHELAAAAVKVVVGVEVIDAPNKDGRGSGAVGLELLAEEPGEAALLAKPTDPAQPRVNPDTPELEFDRLISLPTVAGPQIAGVPVDPLGLVGIDETLRVWESERIWAAGGCVSAALEHSALSARQADAAVEAMASVITGNAERHTAPNLTGVILQEQRDRWLAENPIGIREPSTRCLWWPPGRAVGHMLAQRIAAWDPTVEAIPANLPEGLIVSLPVALGHQVSAPASIDTDTRKAQLREIESRQSMAVRRKEAEAEAELRTMSSDLRALAERQEATIKELRQHGYLRDRRPE